MDARQRLLNEGNYICPNCSKQVVSNSNCIPIPAYKHKDCNDDSKPLSIEQIERVINKAVSNKQPLVDEILNNKKAKDFFDSIEVEE